METRDEEHHHHQQQLLTQSDRQPQIKKNHRRHSSTGIIMSLIPRHKTSPKYAGGCFRVCWLVLTLSKTRSTKILMSSFTRETANSYRSLTRNYNFLEKSRKKQDLEVDRHNQRGDGTCESLWRPVTHFFQHKHQEPTSPLEICKFLDRSPKFVPVCNTTEPREES